VNTICSTLAIHLEMDKNHCSILSTLKAILSTSPPIHDSKVAARLIRAIIPILTHQLPTTADAQLVNSAPKSRKRKQKGVWSESDELLRSQRKVPYSSAEDSICAIRALDVMHHLMVQTIPPHLRIICCRLYLNLLFSLPRTSALKLSPDVQLRDQMYIRVASLCNSLIKDSPGLSSSALGLFEAATHVNKTSRSVLQQLELTIHPRLPPMHLAPNVNDLTILLIQEGSDESQARQTMGLSTSNRVNEQENGVEGMGQSTLSNVSIPTSTNEPNESMTKISNSNKRFPEPVRSPMPPEPTMVQTPLSEQHTPKPVQAIGSEDQQISSKIGTQLLIETIPKGSFALPTQEPVAESMDDFGRRPILAMPMEEDEEEDEPLPEINMESSDEE